MVREAARAHDGANRLPKSSDPLLMSPAWCAAARQSAPTDGTKRRPTLRGARGIAAARRDASRRATREQARGDWCLCKELLSASTTSMSLPCQSRPRMTAPVMSPLPLR